MWRWKRWRRRKACGCAPRCRQRTAADRGGRTADLQVLFNLVGNAIKFTERGEVEVSTALDCQRLIVAVRDTGRGVDSADQARIFEEFQQVAGAPGGPRDGAGLGLAIARRIVELHGGTLWVESAPAPAPRSRSRSPSRRRSAAPPAAETTVERAP
ncbi:MAG: hypothetical protein IPI73_08245 [Betaproteobacteria bacterium]|nr:hypothetical protein [Betaproteobacteria bacterium]